MAALSGHDTAIRLLSAGAVIAWGYTAKAPKPIRLPTGRRPSGGGILHANGRRYAARVVGVDWENCGRAGRPGLPGPSPVLRFRVGSERRPAVEGHAARPRCGVTLPRRTGAHGASR